MPRTTGLSHVTPILALSLALSPAPAAATGEEGAQLWLSLSSDVPLGHGVTSLFQIDERFRQDDDQLVLRAEVESDLADGVVLNGGTELYETAHVHEFRPHQQLSVSTGPLTVRTRLEERFFAGADRPQFRVRPRIQLGWTLDEATYVAAAGEIFYTLRSKAPDEEAGLDQWRGEVSARHTLSSHLSARMVCRAMYSPRRDPADRFGQAAILTLALDI